jgi:hypothetical protein
VKRSTRPYQLPTPFVALLGVYAIASLAHFSHNAQYIASYPGLPGWLTPEKIYIAWLAVSTVGALGFIVRRLGYHIASLVLLGLYGALGLDALAHYALASHSDHTLPANITIWAEAVAGGVVLLSSAGLVVAAVRRAR